MNAGASGAALKDIPKPGLGAATQSTFRSGQDSAHQDNHNVNYESIQDEEDRDNQTSGTNRTIRAQQQAVGALGAEETQTDINRLQIVDEGGKTATETLKKGHTSKRSQPSRHGPTKAAKVHGYHGKEISSSTVGHLGSATAQSKPNFGDKMNLNAKTDTNKLNAD